jgi:hypothetical protein
MKDIRISGKRIKTEITAWLLCFCAAFALNVYSIIKYNTKWWELITQLHVIVILSCVVYFFAAIVRFLIYAVKTIVAGTKRSTDSRN